jgi:hypothetical protein
MTQTLRDGTLLMPPDVTGQTEETVSAIGDPPRRPGSSSLGPSSCPYARTSWNTNSAKFAVTAFSEVRSQLATENFENRGAAPQIHRRFIADRYARIDCQTRGGGRADTGISNLTMQ